MSDINLNLIPKFVDNAISPVAKEAGEAFADIIRIARIPITDYLKKHEVRLEIALKKLREELEKIPDENIIMPKASMVGPAIENMFKYDLEEDYIIEAFSKLIAASMDKDEANKVHPLLFKIVEQMSPLDAKVFKSIFADQYGTAYTIQPEQAFSTTGFFFRAYHNYEIVLLDPETFSYDNLAMLCRAYDSIIYMSNLGLLGKGRDVKYNIYSPNASNMLNTDIPNRIREIVNYIKKNTIASIAIKNEVEFHTWHATNIGRQLADILKLYTFNNSNDMLFHIDG